MRTDHGPDVDLALTTREFIRVLRADHLDPSLLPEEPLDDPMGTFTGAGTIFGTTGGVLEAALRTAYAKLTGENPDPELFAPLRNGIGLRDAVYTIAGKEIRCAVVSGLGNTRQLIQALKRKEVHYDFVEVMACPGGCAGGGGQPIPQEDEELEGVRGEQLRTLDKRSRFRFSHENPHDPAAVPGIPGQAPEPQSRSPAPYGPFWVENVKRSCCIGSSSGHEPRVTGRGLVGANRRFCFSESIPILSFHLIEKEQTA